MIIKQIHELTLGDTKISLADAKSCEDLVITLMALDFNTTMSKRIITGNKQELSVYEIKFAGKIIKSVGLTDTERISNIILEAGCTQLTINKIVEDKEDDRDH